MKLRCMYFFSFTLLLAPCVIRATSPNTGLEPERLTTPQPTARKEPKSDYSDPVQFMNDFLDMTKKPNMPLKYWALQLVLLLKTNRGLNGFCNKLKDIATNQDPYKNIDTDTRASAINRAFVDAHFQNLFPEDLSKLIFAKLVSAPERAALLDAIKQRAAKFTA